MQNLAEISHGGANLPTLSAEHSSLAATLSRWRVSEPLPHGTTAEGCRAVIEFSTARMRPCGRQSAAVMLDRLFAIWPVASEAAAAVWIDVVAEKPAMAVADAIERMLRSSRQYPPKPADLLAEVAADERLRKLYAAKLKAETALRLLRANERMAALWEAHRRDRDERLAALRERVAGRQEGATGGLKRIEPGDDEAPDGEAQARLERDRRAFLDALAAEGIE